MGYVADPLDPTEASSRYEWRLWGSRSAASASLFEVRSGPGVTMRRSPSQGAVSDQTRMLRSRQSVFQKAALWSRLGKIVLAARLQIE